MVENTRLHVGSCQQDRVKLETEEEGHVERSKERGWRKRREIKNDGTLAKNFTHPREWCMQISAEGCKRDQSKSPK